MHSIFKELIHPLYELDNFFGAIKREDYRSKIENPINLNSENPSKNFNSSNDTLKERIVEYYEIVEDIIKTKNKLNELENKKIELEKELLNDPIAKSVINELNNSKDNLRKVNKK